MSGSPVGSSPGPEWQSGQLIELLLEDVLQPPPPPPPPPPPDGPGSALDELEVDSVDAEETLDEELVDTTGTLLLEEDEELVEITGASLLLEDEELATGASLLLEDEELATGASLLLAGGGIELLEAERSPLSGTSSFPPCRLCMIVTTMSPNIMMVRRTATLLCGCVCISPYNSKN
jgi:hypothetical protein